MTERIGVVGAGVMGRDIAGLLANAGYDVVLVDVDETALSASKTDLNDRIPAELAAADLRTDEDLIDRVSMTTGTTALTETPFVVEAVPEALDLKRDLVTDLEATIPAEAIIATNTSSLTARDVARDATHPERIVLFHFANPAIPRELVEIAGEAATSTAIDRATQLAEAIGKRPIVLQGERRGNGLSRLSAAIKCAASWELTRTSVGAIERAAHQVGFERGPIELIDRIGIDVHLATVDNLAEEYGTHFDPPEPIRDRLEGLIEADRLGMKTAGGLLEWTDGEPVIPTAEEAYDITPVLAALVNEAHRLVADGIADRETTDEILRRGSGGAVGPFDVEAMVGSEHVRSVLEERYEETDAGVFQPANALRE